MRLMNTGFIISFIIFITIVIVLLWYSWVNNNDRGRYVALGSMILLLIISSFTIYKYQKAKHFSYISMRINYDEFVKELDISYLEDSKLEQNEDFKRQFDLLYNRTHALMINSEVTPISSIFTSESMREVLPQITEKIYNIGFILAQEDYALRNSTVTNISGYLREIGLILGSPSGEFRYGKNSINYEEKQIDKIKLLVDKISKILNDEVGTVLKSKEYSGSSYD